MDRIFHQNVQKIHFIGIGGISMSGLAKLCRHMGYAVTGSDSADNDEVLALRRLGIPVFSGHAEEQVGDADVVVYSSAIGTDNPELLRAVLEKKCVLSRGKFLGLAAKSFKKTVAVSGAHGKTTASAMLAEALRRFGFPFCYHIGGVLQLDGENTACFGEELFVCEACEYKRNFLSLSPDIGVVLNIDFDHPDYYRDLADVRSAYESFAARSARTIGHISAGELCDLTFGLAGETDGRGRGPDVVADNLRQREDGFFCFDVLREGGLLCRAVSPSPFRHNVRNLLAALCVLGELGLDLNLGAEYLAEFHGVRRRFERIRTEDLEVWSDYAHHPAQVAGVIRALKEEGHRVLCCFEPHTYSRTVKLFCEFSEALSMADEVILLPVYAAREAFVPGVAEALAESVARRTPCRLLSFEEAFEALREGEGTKVLLGAGNFDEWFRRRAGIFSGNDCKSAGDGV